MTEISSVANELMDQELRDAQAAFNAIRGDLASAGIAEEQVVAAKKIAESRIRGKYVPEAVIDQAATATPEVKPNEQEDLLQYTAGVLDQAVQTPEDRVIVDNIKRRMEAARTGWRERFDWAKKTLGETSPDRIVWRIRGQNMQPTFVEHSEERGKVLIDVMWGANSKDPKAATVDTYPSDALRERVLKGLGALKDDQSLEDLEGLSRTGTIFRDGLRFVEHLSTSIPDVTVRVGFGSPQGRISLELSPQQLAQLIAQPVSTPAPTAP